MDVRTWWAFAAAMMLAGVAYAAPPTMRFANPWQPWASPDGLVHLLRPLQATVSVTDQPAGSLMAQGWRLVWDGSSSAPGRPVVRLALPVAPVSPETRATEYLQVGSSRDPAVVRSCLAAGLKGPNAAHERDRTINGRRFAVWSNSDAGMSQQITALDLRTVADGACWAVERFRYSDSASPPPTRPLLSEAYGVARMDRALASLQIGRLAPGQALAPPHLATPAGTVAY